MSGGFWAGVAVGAYVGALLVGLVLAWAAHIQRTAPRASAPTQPERPRTPPSAPDGWALDPRAPRPSAAGSTTPRDRGAPRWQENHHG